MMSSSKRDETPPDWLNGHFVEKALRRGLKNDRLRVDGCHIEMATAAGDHYGSQMLRVRMSLREGEEPGKEFSVVVKTIPRGLVGDFLRSSMVFVTEEEAIARTLPEIDELLAKVYPGQEKLAARCYYHEGSPDNLLVLEDLKRGGFRLANRFEGLDYEHTALVMESLAKLHAGSLAVYGKNPEKFRKFETYFWAPRNIRLVQDLIETPIKFLGEEIESWQETREGENWSEVISRLDVPGKIFDAWEKTESQISCLLHGDSWLNNFMFRYDSGGKVDGLRLVDFQLSTLHSPVMDLQYVIFSSVNPDLKYDRLDEFLSIYYKTFEDALSRLNHKSPAFRGYGDFLREFESKFFWGFVVGMAFCPLMQLPPDEVMHADDILKADKRESYRKAVASKRIREMLLKGLRFFKSKRVIG